MEKTPELHYTQESMARDLIALIPFREGDSFLDAGSGRNKVWFNNLPSPKKECEIEDGDYFYSFSEATDWVVGSLYPIKKSCSLATILVPCHQSLRTMYQTER